MAEQEGDRLGQIGATGSLGQQAGEGPRAKLATVSGEAAQFVPSLGTPRRSPYLGRELARAEHVLRSGARYEQDAAPG
jgi:hypothetical protein